MCLGLPSQRKEFESPIPLLLTRTYMKKPQVKEAILFHKVEDPETIKWVQSRLVDGGYLDEGDVDGIAGPKSVQALKNFKNKNQLSYPAAIGSSTVEALDRLSGSRPKLSKATLLKEVEDKELILWVQSKLANGGYLTLDDVDGEVGPKTLKALATFKKAAYLSYPAAVGSSTIEELDQLTPKHKVSEQKDIPKDYRGKSIIMPQVGVVYSEQQIVPGCNLTWGEMTRGFTRLPVSHSGFGSQKEVVNNLILTAKAFGKVRDKFGSPIRVTSAYRPPHLKIGATYSQHKYGRGLDLQPINGNYSDLLAAIKSIPEIKGIGLAGPRRGFWHMDIRPTSRRVCFGY